LGQLLQNSGLQSGTNPETRFVPLP